MLTVKPLLTMIFIQNAKGVMRGENQVFFHLKRQRDDHFLANFYTLFKSVLHKSLYKSTI